MINIEVVRKIIHLIGVIYNTKLYYIIFCMLYFFLLFFQGKISGHFATKNINELFNKSFPIIENNAEYRMIKDELIKTDKLKEVLVQYYNCNIKFYMYLVMGIASLTQIVAYLSNENFDRVNINACIITGFIALLESRDNYYNLKDLFKEQQKEIDKLIKDYQELDEEVIKDIVEKNI